MIDVCDKLILFDANYYMKCVYWVMPWALANVAI